MRVLSIIILHLELFLSLSLVCVCVCVCLYVCCECQSGVYMCVRGYIVECDWRNECCAVAWRGMLYMCVCGVCK